MFPFYTHAARLDFVDSPPAHLERPAGSENFQKFVFWRSQNMTTLVYKLLINKKKNPEEGLLVTIAHANNARARASA